MAKQFDLIVLGTGAGGSTVAKACRKAGWSVAIVDGRPYGGTCALRGCDPKKVLVGVAEAVNRARQLRGKGIEGEPRIRWPDLMRFKSSFTEPVPAGRERGFAEAGIESFRGIARFTGSTALEVAGERLDARHVHIATGSRPADLPIRGAEHLTTSERFLALDNLPGRVLFLGSGYIAFEFAHVTASSGARVTMLEMQDRPLAGFDQDLVSILLESTRSMGIDVQVKTQVVAIEKRRDGFVVHATSEAGAVTFETDMVVHSAGRVPDIGDLHLDQAGIEHGKDGIAVNEFMQSVSNPAVYAAGDVARGSLPLTPVASFEAQIAAANLLQGNHRKIEYPPIPSVVFTLPPLASVGLQENEARDKELKFQIKHERTSSWYSSRRVGEEASGFKVLIEEQTGKILGAHLLGPQAEELINLFAMAMSRGMTARDIKKSIFAYPTAGSDMPHMV